MSRSRDFADLAGSADVGGLTGRNLIINGAMTVAQRGTSGTVTGDNQYLSLDRWGSRTYGGTGAFSVAQDTTVPSGQTFTNSLKATVTTTATSGTYGYAIKHNLEGYVVNQLRAGTSDALKSTLSFWARSSVAGTYCCSVRATGGAASYVFEYTLAADTWTKIEHTIAEPTTTTPSWDRTNAADFLFEWSLGGQTSKQTATTESWHNGNYTSTSNQTDWIATSGATFYITGVQLEVGETATPFEHRSFGDELARCCRYYYKADYRLNGLQYKSANRNVIDRFPVEMRAIPTLTTGTNESNSGSWTNSGSALNTKNYMAYFTAEASTSNTTRYVGGYTADAEL